ncbi:MAG: hypothetical protein Q4G14_01400 [Paracoccus sp. (in: a-proteobacteria)]|uniref:hypothetical protein n=1 Tax=Paracoccus sp. TaxID=267 RepID=UPI0026DFE1E3|nr:hypothetical protein [Paracoccus sp. (in: a-proteobacteria)]MDO5611881.1 hypothetical protein [Paracoccus sp. (in: a-proteobacteria)]
MTRTPPAARDIWQEFHWAFFLNTQGLILSLQRFALLQDAGDMAGAAGELDAAAVLMDASAAAMQLAGSFTRADYETEVRPSMTPPHVQSEGFSGLMSWEHGVLVNLWRSLRPRFAELPDALAPAHARFANAYRCMAEGHVNVCARFVGNGNASLRYDNREALVSLRRFGQTRLASIDPNGVTAEHEE